MTRSEAAQHTPPTGDTSLRVELAVARATAAARAGDLAAALDELDRHDDPAVTGHRDVLDLRARVHAQRGDLDAAEQSWRRLLEAHPDDPAATAGLARIARYRRTGPLAALYRAPHRLWPAAAVVVLAGAVTAAAWAIPSESSGDGSRSPDLPAAVASAQKEVREEIAEKQARRAAAAEARRRAAVDAVAKAVRSPAVRVVKHEDSVEVVFRAALFVEGAELTDSGSAALTRLGKQLAELKDVRIAVYGHIAEVDGAPTSGGSPMSAWRAQVAAQRLSDVSGRPLSSFTVASGEQRDAPYDTPARNRTATVVLTPQPHG